MRVLLVIFWKYTSIFSQEKLSLRYKNINRQLACFFFVTMPSLVLSCYSILCWVVWHSWVHKGICSLRVSQFECHTLGNIWKHAISLMGTDLSGMFFWYLRYVLCQMIVFQQFTWFFSFELIRDIVCFLKCGCCYSCCYLYSEIFNFWFFLKVYPINNKLAWHPCHKIAINLVLDIHISCLWSCVPSFVDAGLHIGFTLEFCLQWEVLIFFVFINPSASS